MITKIISRYLPASLIRHHIRWSSKKTLKRQAEREQITYELAGKNTKKAQRLYAFGFSPTGALGMPHLLFPSADRKNPKEVHCVRQPFRMSFFPENRLTVHSTACGFGFSLFACSEQEGSWKLYGCGLNSDSQLGLQTRSVSGQVHSSKVEIVTEPQRINLDKKGGRHPEFVQVACGRAHTLVHCRSAGDDFVLSLGNNSAGQCGREVVEGEIYAESARVNRMQLPAGLGQIKQIECGQDHSLILTESGSVYSCGLGSDGQTGLGCYDNVWKPTRVKGDIDGVKIGSLSSRGDTILAVSESGDVFGWGNSEYGQVCSEEMQVSIPRHLAMPMPVVQAAASGSVCAVTDHMGQVFVWGYGELGLGPNTFCAPQPTLLPPGLFGQSELSPEAGKVTSLTCGLHHFAAVTSSGQLYVWGANRSGCLGLGSREAEQSFPLRVSIPGVVERVSCGVDHTIVVGRAFA